MVWVLLTGMSGTGKTTLLDAVLPRDPLTPVSRHLQISKMPTENPLRARC